MQHRESWCLLEVKFPVSHACTMCIHNSVAVWVTAPLVDSVSAEAMVLQCTRVGLTHSYQQSVITSCSSSISSSCCSSVCSSCLSCHGGDGGLDVQEISVNVAEV